MPEIKNTFIQSKMNQDLDGRLLPNGQYRDALNVQISKSESEDAGALENVLGNTFLTDFGFTNDKLEIIGHLESDTLDTLFLFLTEYYDSSFNSLQNSCVGTGVDCYIVSYNVALNQAKVLVQGDFLNFSKSHPITGVDLIEELLFFTDNRNQPRKININLAQPGYYTDEDQISVAKYYPYDPIILLDPTSDLNSKFNSSMKDKVSKYLPIHAAAKVDSVDAANQEITVIGSYTNIMPNTPATNLQNGDLVSGKNITPNKSESVVQTVSFQGSGAAATTTINVNGTYTGDIEEGDIIYFQRQNPDYNETWAGDPTFLQDKFARFSYRFKFEDGEYSLSAPFTQIAFIPKQDGYFIGTDAEVGDTTNRIKLVGQESEAYDSTVVRFMENKVNNINLNIPSPTKGNYTDKIGWENIKDVLKIIEIDILYKEADSNKTTIIDTLTEGDFNNADNISNNYLQYDYQSRKPWKTLSPQQTTRVSDIVPVRALAQASSGNRIIYGNFIDKHSSPDGLNYSVQVNDKVSLPKSTSTLLAKNDPNNYVRKEYQNHTLKQNRNYQVGLVLSDRYGRQSNVILSNVIDTTIASYVASTFYHRYSSTEDNILLDKYPAWPGPSVPPIDVNTPVDPYTWPGDQINAIFWSVIPELKTQDGYPGIYSEADGSVASLTSPVIYPIFPGNVPCGPYTVVIEGRVKSGTPPTATIEFSVDKLGNVINVVILSSSNDWDQGQSFTGDLSTSPSPPPPCNVVGGQEITGFVQTTIDNRLGWHSYKFVIKQTEQEYYNIYLPGALAGYPCDVIGIDASTETDPNDPNSTITTEATPELLYPKGQRSNTSHIVLFGDNINKLPKDLNDVGPLANKFRSSVRLFGRVTTWFDQSAQQQTLQSKQYDPETNWDIAVEIGSMESLGLGDLKTNPVDPILPIQFYKASTNPLIARLETKKQFGTIKALNDDCNDALLGYSASLAIYETEPVTSLLDIFWETTTSGLIKELNNNIAFEDNTLPTGLTFTDISWSESDPYESYISNTFEASNADGQGLGPVASITLNSVIRGDQTDVTNSFTLEEQGAGSGEYQIKTTPYSSANPGQIHHEDQSKNYYYFNFTINYTPGAGTSNPSVSIPVQREGYIYNAYPVPRSNINWTAAKDQVYAGKAVLTTESSRSVGPLQPFYDGTNPTFSSFSNATANRGSYCGFPVDIEQTQISAMQGTNAGAIGSWDTKTALMVTAVGNITNASPPGYFGTGSNSKTATGHWTAIDKVDCDGGVQSFGNNVVNINAPSLTLDTTTNTTELCLNNANISVNITKDFQAKNGAWGSDPNDPFPGVELAGDEIKFTIQRMYQVSAYVSTGDFTRAGTYVPGEKMYTNNSPYHQVPWMTNYSKWGLEGLNPAKQVAPVWNIPSYPFWDPSFPQGQQSSLGICEGCGPLEVIFGYNSYIPFQVSATGQNEATGWPQGPILYDFNQPNQLLPQSGGEEFVGEKQNNLLHYWPDLRVIAANQAATPVNALGNGQVPNVSKIIPGYNTFYSARGPRNGYFKWVSDSPDPTIERVVPSQSNFNDYIKDGSNGQINDRFAGYSYYMGAQSIYNISGVDYLAGQPRTLFGGDIGNDIDNLLLNFPTDPNNSNSLYSSSTFFATTKPLGFNGAFAKPTQGELSAGNPQYSFGNRIVGMPNNYGASFSESDLGHKLITGNIVPPGRYVVTFAATDMNGTGLSYEWDVPISIAPGNDAPISASQTRGSQLANYSILDPCWGG